VSANKLRSASALTIFSHRQRDNTAAAQFTHGQILGQILFHHLTWSKDAMTAWNPYRNSHTMFWEPCQILLLPHLKFHSLNWSYDFLTSVQNACINPLCILQPSQSWYLFISFIIYIYLVLVTFDTKREECNGVSNYLLHGIVVVLFVETTRYRNGTIKLAWCPAKSVKGLMHLNSLCWNRYNRYQFSVINIVYYELVSIVY